MVNLVEAWAEHYAIVRPTTSVQVAGGGTGVGIAGLIEGIVDIAAAGRHMKSGETERAKAHNGTEPREFIIGYDALAVYVNDRNPVDALSLEQLANIYGDGGRIEYWTQLGVTHRTCRSDRIVRVSRQNNSGTYAYFRDVVLGATREYKLGSIDQSGSKDVVALVARTPCAIGYSGMAFATPGAKTLRLSTSAGRSAVAPTVRSAIEGTYPMVRPLYLYTPGGPTGQTKAFIDWVTGPVGQRIVREVGFVPVRLDDKAVPWESD